MDRIKNYFTGGSSSSPNSNKSRASLTNNQGVSQICVPSGYSKNIRPTTLQKPIKQKSVKRMFNSLKKTSKKFELIKKTEFMLRFLEFFMSSLIASFLYRCVKEYSEARLQDDQKQFQLTLFYYYLCIAVNMFSVFYSFINVFVVVKRNSKYVLNKHFLFFLISIDFLLIFFFLLGGSMLKFSHTFNSVKTSLEYASCTFKDTYQFDWKLNSSYKIDFPQICTISIVCASLMYLMAVLMLISFMFTLLLRFRWKRSRLAKN